MQVARGSTLYRDVWFDKPPLVSAICLLWGARAGIALRTAGAVYSMLVCLAAYLLAARLWTRREGYWAAALLGFFLVFDTHSAVVPLAADMLLVLPHLLALLFAVRKQPFWSGAAAGVGFLFNAKAVLVLAACALFAGPGFLSLLAGFAVPNLAVLGWMAGNGSLRPFIDQVWRWPAQYAASPIVDNPVWNGVVRTANWLGFHAILAVGAFALWLRRPSWRFFAWAVLAYGGVVLGWRFFPRYFFLLLPPMVIAASRGMTLFRTRIAIAIAVVTMAVPFARFGPRYVLLAGDLLHQRRSQWSDLALDQDSQDAARLALAHAKPDSTLYVWGYRPDMYVYTALRPSGKFLDCQALTGVPADRHLTRSDVVLTRGTHEAREDLARSTPDIVIDGLGLYNPALAITIYPELRPWIAQYREAGRTKGSVIYVRRTNTIGS